MIKTRAIGLTGGIGSGKSSVAKIFADLGVPVLDLDGVGRTCLADDVIQARLIAQFGSDIVDADGSLHRKKLASLAFSDAEHTNRLNQILHPEIQQREAVWLQAQNAPFAIIEASVLLESGGEGRMDAMVVVLADLALRRERVLRRGEQNEGLFDMIVARQCDDAQRRDAADFLIENSGDFEHLKRQVGGLYVCLKDDYC